MDFIKKDPIIILIAGQARSGKGTISKYLEHEFLKLGKKVVTSPYTKYLKIYIQEITGQTINEDNKPRDMLQQLSSKLIKNKLKKENFFIDRQIEDIEIYSYFMDVILIPDVRFPKEIEIIKQKFPNTISIGVKRKNYISTLTKEQQNDITETALNHYDQYDYVIENDKEEDLYEKVLKIFNEIKERR